jgi:hypothetical protein
LVDPGTGMAVLGSAPVVLKIVGPTADYVGGGVKNLVERQVENVERVFSKAAARLGEEGLERPGVVPPRVLKEVIEGASFCEDELGAEYFGGILAGAKSENGRDDRGASLAALAGRLSSYQLRCHYLMYATAQRLLKGSGRRLGFSNERRAYGHFFLPYRTWLEGMEFNESERSRRVELAGHCCAGLIREDLIDPSGFGWGEPKNLAELFGREFDEGGVAFCLSVLGIELFTAAHGIRESPLVAFVSPSQSFESAVEPSAATEVFAIRDLPKA